MMTYTLKEVSKRINTAPGTLRQWEKEYEELLQIPRSKQGARIYSNSEIEQLLEIKEMSANKFSKDMIRQSLLRKLEPENEDVSNTPELSLEIISESVTTNDVDDHHLKNADLFFEAMETYKKTFLNEIKDEIRSVVRKEVLDEVKREISKGTLLTVKSLSDSIYKSTANTKSEIHALSETVEKGSALTSDSLQYLSNSIATVSIETSEEIFTLSKQFSETTEELSHYVGVTNNEILGLSEALSKNHEFFVEERNQYRHEITQRELAFQQMLASYRDVAAAREKRWWKFWS
ncbi:MerR family transcriptional regulator [Neobacillus soli]|uniref:MerR family transcriptional regulator n=1 Tax=Neobacillus soli TaxID=220688 RepID=UPI00082588BE|nr:MerR family transcriptional regulator [Neobacillus soli]